MYLTIHSILESAFNEKKVESPYALKHIFLASDLHAAIGKKIANFLGKKLLDWQNNIFRKFVGTMKMRLNTAVVCHETLLLQEEPNWPYRWAGYRQ